MQRHILLILFFTFAYLSQSQPLNLEKAQQAIEDGLYERAYKLTGDALEHEVTKKDALSYYLHAKSLFELNKKPTFAKKNPEAFKDVCKLVIKARLRDKDKKYEGKFDDLIAELVSVNNALADEEYNVNRYPKAIKLYTVSYGLNSDRTAYYMIGKSYQMNTDTNSAKSHYRILIQGYEDDLKNEEAKSQPIIEPFLFLTDIQWKKKNFDSANYYLDMARRVFGEKNSKINFYQYLLAKDQIKNQPPSSLMMEIIRKALVYNPADTFFIKKENALALYLIRNAIDGPNQTEADSMIFRFTRAKALKANNPAYENIKSADMFLQPFAENIIWKISDYYFTNTHDKAASYLAKKYIIKTAIASDTIAPTDKEIIARWVKIIEFAHENETPGYVALLFTQASTDYPASKELIALKKKLSLK